MRKKVLQHVVTLFRNFYFTTFFCVVVWLAFFDENDFVSQWKLSSKLRDLRREKSFYEQKIQEVQKEKNEVLGNIHSVEKFARERYLMKKPTEDIYLIKKTE